MRCILGPLAVLVVGSAGCGNEALRSGGHDAGALVSEAGAPPHDAAPGLVLVGRPVTGTFVAPGVSATIAFPGGAGFLQQVPYQSPPYRFYLDSGEPGSASQVTFDGVPGVVSTAFSVALEIGAALPRAWPSAAGCGYLLLTGYFPPDADAGCGPLTDAGVCPPGCVPEITLVGGASPCQVTTPTISYEAFTSAQCSFGSDPEQGNWTLSLTSIDSNFDVDGVLSSPGLYLVHGTLTAELVGGMQGGADGGDAGRATGTLRLDF